MVLKKKKKKKKKKEKKNLNHPLLSSSLTSCNAHAYLPLYLDLSASHGAHGPASPASVALPMHVHQLHTIGVHDDVVTTLTHDVWLARDADISVAPLISFVPWNVAFLHDVVVTAKQWLAAAPALMFRLASLATLVFFDFFRPFFVEDQSDVSRQVLLF